jgi:hypothetical protein
MDLNPLFTGYTSFKPSGLSGGELQLFEKTGIQLVHGWLVEPGSPEHFALAHNKDYDGAVTLVVEADHLTNGKLVNSIDESGPSGSSSSGPASALTEEEQKKVEDGT